MSNTVFVCYFTSNNTAPQCIFRYEEDAIDWVNRYNCNNGAKYIELVVE